MDLSKEINKTTLPFEFQFSICTIVNNTMEYRLMRNSFEEAGFNGSCEYITIDNSNQNRMDAYKGINWFLNTVKGEFIIIVHQDVRCIDRKEKLISVLKQLALADPSWAVCGNAGCNGYRNCYFYMIYPGKEKPSKQLPKKVTSLDEALLIVNALHKPALSANLKGFHLYGTDICLNAEREGHTSYVIPFLTEHLSTGNLSELTRYLPAFLDNYDYTRKNKTHFIQTTCTKFYLGNSRRQTSLYNKKILFEIIKAWERIKGFFKKK
jgi:hypothetical protein